ncbi:MAG TPA: FAD-dependent oxidoreductase [Ktedonobacteraceae bacterium]|nr:FAD-dependent oxidoreductase [Ktedonobacteraceae bacterium]
MSLDDLIIVWFCLIDDVLPLAVGNKRLHMSGPMPPIFNLEKTKAMPDYDYVIVGGGISGLMTALRLATCGFRIGLFEKGEIGSEASTSNHGMIHSGALYAELHPDVAAMCVEANTLFRQTFSDAIVPLEDTWYFASSQRLEHFKQLWQLHGIPFTDVERTTWEAILQSEPTTSISCASLPDFVVSPRRILVELVQLCLDLGVEISPMTSVHEIIVRQGTAAAIRVGLRETVSAHQVILCAGLGLMNFLKQIESRALGQLRPRLGMMVLFDNYRLNRALLCLEQGGPTVAPTYGSPVLVSLFNGLQPNIRRNGKWPVAASQITEVVKQTRKYLQNDMLCLETGRAYVCSKTELAVGNDTWATKPAFVCMNHERIDGIRHLWSLIPGKWTLSFHATHSLVSQLLHENLGLNLPIQVHTVSAAADDVVATEPWWDPDKKPLQSFSNREPSVVTSVPEREHQAQLIPN